MMKYIIFKRGAFELPVLFPQLIEHSSVHIAPDRGGNPAEPIAAGFCDETGHCMGKSVSLKLESRQQDSAIVKLAMEFDI
jgi:hypothetical protein